MEYRKVLNRAFWLVVVIALTVAAVNVFGVDDWWTLHQSFKNLCDGREVAQARDDLIDLNDRARVLKALRTKLDETGDTIKCKKNYLQTLEPRYFNQARSIRRALDSASPATRRAAATLRYGDPELRDRCAEIALEWLRDPEADSRHEAALICRQLKLEDAVPTLLGFLEVQPETSDDLLLLQHTLGALKEFQPPGLADRLLAMVDQTELDQQTRGIVLETLGRLDDAPREKVQALAIRLLEDQQADTVLRGKAAAVLGAQRFADETTWSALQRRLLDEKDGDEIVQRLCLNKLGDTAPLDRIRKLLYDRRVYTHRYFGIRVNVATALAALNVRESVAFDILCQYLVDTDPDDDQFTVRQEAWLSLWTLTGVAYGIPQKELFVRAPKPMPDAERTRRYLWSWTYTRPGVSQGHVTALKNVVSDLEQMKRIRQTFQDKKAAITAGWEEARRAEEEAQKKKEPAAVDPVGPRPPK
ncbi:MAG: hypothetical protein ACYTEZ_17470 [Planctomycetota bacterium]|jgi:hypothetical protein